MRRIVVATGKSPTLDVDVWVPSSSARGEMRHIVDKALRLKRRVTWRLVLESDDD